MKSILCTIPLILSFNAQALDLTHFHLLPDSEGREYQQLLSQHSELLTAPADDPLREILKYGAQNLKWLDQINSKLKEPLELWTPENTKAYPIEAPGTSNRQMVLSEFQILNAEVPPAFWAIIESYNTPPDHTNGLSTEDYLTWARKLDRVYQRASRWLLEEPTLALYAARAKDDLRAIYFLLKTPNLKTKLSRWSELSADDQAQFRKWLLKICTKQTLRDSRCSKIFADEIKQKNSAVDYYDTYAPKEIAHYNSYFKLPVKRQDLDWNSKLSTIPFIDPRNEAIKQWLKVNIEDEWRWGEWSLVLNFVSSGMGHAHVEFQAGATPHVNGLGGNTITMDANLPLQQYSSRWTIRHEYGHVLGFPDCYLEFYDTKEKVMINYQIDITNLMCSRRGHLKQIHFDELKRVYQN